MRFFVVGIEIAVFAAAVGYLANRVSSTTSSPARAASARAEGRSPGQNPSPAGSSATAGAVSPTSIPPATKVHSPEDYYVRGVDQADSWLFVIDTSNGALRQSTDWGTTWSANKGLPGGVRPDQVSKIVRFGSYLYMLATSGKVAGVWRAAPTPGDAPLAWSSQLLTLDTGARTIMTDLDASAWGSDDYLFCGEYGDPVGGPSIWRISLQDANGSGTNWERSYGPDHHQRHVHAVAPDPYEPGNVWATLGDGGTRTILRSTNSGATWSVVVANYLWQGVQISFDPHYIYIAHDQSGFTYEVIDRTTLRPRVAAPNWHAQLAVRAPGASRAQTYAIAYYGAVDPATGAYYCVANDESSPGNWMGMFAAPKVGFPLVVIDPGGHDISMNGEIFIAHGTVYSGVWEHPVLSSG